MRLLLLMVVHDPAQEIGLADGVRHALEVAAGGRSYSVASQETHAAGAGARARVIYVHVSHALNEDRVSVAVHAMEAAGEVGHHLRLGVRSQHRVGAHFLHVKSQNLLLADTYKGPRAGADAATTSDAGV